MKKPTQTIFHLEFKKAGTHLYYGSIAAIFDVFDKDAIGISAKSLYNYNITEDKPFINKIVVIRKGAVHRKPTMRKNPATVIKKFHNN